MRVGEKHLHVRERLGRIAHQQTEAAQTAAASLDLQRRSYAVGNSGILDVIDAQRSSAQAQLGLAHAKAQRLIDSP